MGPPGCVVDYADWIGDDLCDEGYGPYNTAECNWDGGDCCPGSDCKDPDYTGGNFFSSTFDFFSTTEEKETTEETETDITPAPSETTPAPSVTVVDDVDDVNKG